MKSIQKVLRAFWKAIVLTLRGQQIQPADLRYPQLDAWVKQGVTLTDAVFSVAERAGLHQSKRQQLTLRLDGRDTSMDVILGAVRHNLTLEYPLLMETTIEHNLTVLYALNMNDQYRVAQLASDDRLSPDVREAVQTLSHHLQAIPSSTEMASSP